MAVAEWESVSIHSRDCMERWNDGTICRRLLGVQRQLLEVIYVEGTHPINFSTVVLYAT